ncbi:MAG: UDP-N-acetylmuramoyl-tripeptide--D-alanyl-D-alanine ligase [Candidatus Omnitrophota bacterium]
MFSFRDASAALGVPLQLDNPQSHACGASLDSRKIRPGELFVALPGVRTDGHIYLGAAFQNGASGALILDSYWVEHREKWVAEPRSIFNLLPVPHVEVGLQRLADWNRSRFCGILVAVTGSVGKTTTKEFIHYLLGQKLKGRASSGNLNNHLGVPLTLLGIDPEDGYGVCELGANHPGEIRGLSQLARPTIAVITRIAPAHLEGFGSLAAIYKAKLEILEGMKAGDAVIVPDDDSKLIAKVRTGGFRPVKVGSAKGSDYRLQNVRASDGLVKFEVNGKDFSFDGHAAFLAQNAALAVAAAEVGGFPIADMPSHWVISAFPQGRFQLSRVGEWSLIDDTYNASPRAFAAALKTFDEMKAGDRKVLVFSDMLELGKDSRAYHERLGEAIAETGVENIFAYGPQSRFALESLRGKRRAVNCRHFPDMEDLQNFLAGFLRAGDIILLKGSRGMRVDRVVDFLKGFSSKEKK